MSYQTLTSLTPSEREIARLAKAGKTNQEIAEKLAVSKETVKTHMSHILSKLQIYSREDIDLDSQPIGG